MSISMPPEMADDIDEEAKKHGMKTAEYARHLFRQAPDSPFDEPETTLVTDENYEDGNRRRNEGAA